MRLPAKGSSFGLQETGIGCWGRLRHPRNDRPPPRAEANGTRRKFENFCGGWRVDVAYRLRRQVEISVALVAERWTGRCL